MLAWMKARQSNPGESGPPADREKEPDPVAAAHAAKAVCQARLEQVRCELEVERLEEPKRERERKEQERLARERTVQTWREEEAQRRKARRTRWQTFWENRRKREESLQGQSGTFQALAALSIPAALALLIYAFPQDHTGEVVGVGLLTAASAFAVGALLGFLFGIPRSIAAASAAAGQSAANGKIAAGEAAAAQHFAANTNLEQISDWLTKILVGVGLVQIHEVSGAIEDLANGLAPGLGSQGFAVAVALLVAFSITGFVGAYLFTRLRLQGAFELASALKQAAKVQAEAAAIALVQQQLTPGPDKPTLDALTKALQEAPNQVRVQAFFLARRQRREDWSDEGSEEEKKEFGGLSIPVFQALIDCDTEKQYYRSRAELAYARLELSPPQLAAAKTSLDEAIELRPSSLINRTPLYELNRAYATIKLDPNFQAKKPSPDAVAEEVCRDLEAVIDFLSGVEKEKHADIETWLERNSDRTGSPLQRRVSSLRDLFRKVPPT